MKEVHLGDEKYKYLFTVDSINDQVREGISFRQAYMEVGRKVQDGTYKPSVLKKHTHIGSKDNLCLQKIAEKKANAKIN